MYKRQLVKSLPLIVRTFKEAMGDYGKGREAGTLRTEQDLPLKLVLLGVLIIAVVMWLLPAIPLNFFTALIVIVFGFFFATVSSRMVGLIGSSNNPVSGMAIATLLISTLLLKATGNDGIQGMIAAIVIGGIICVIAAIAGDTSQDLKTGFLVGATPRKQQMGEMVGVVVSAVVIGAILYLLSMAWGGYGSDDLPAPQAMLMKMIVEGVMGGNLPWNLVFTGVFIAIVVEIQGIPVLPFAIGLYLPIYLSVPMILGGALRWYLEKRKCGSEKEKNDSVQSGVLYSSGLIAGEGIVGILLAGWSSNNKYSLIGAMRSGAQMISYELSIGLSILTIIVLTDTMQFSEIVARQADGWFIFKGHIPAMIAFVIYLIAGNAEVNRGPFDLPEAESELTAGYHTEYSGMHFGLFYVAEFVNLFIIAGVASTIFLGGWMPLHISGWEGFNTVMDYIPGFVWFFGKTLFVIWLLMWIKWTFPRLRVDQILTLEWKYLVPIGLVNLLLMVVIVVFKLHF